MITDVIAHLTRDTLPDWTGVKGEARQAVTIYRTDDGMLNVDMIFGSRRERVVDGNHGRG